MTTETKKSPELTAKTAPGAEETEPTTTAGQSDRIISTKVSRVYLLSAPTHVDDIEALWLRGGRQTRINCGHCSSVGCSACCE